MLLLLLLISNTVNLYTIAVVLWRRVHIAVFRFTLGDVIGRRYWESWFSPCSRTGKTSKLICAPLIDNMSDSGRKTYFINYSVLRFCFDGSLRKRLQFVQTRHQLRNRNATQRWLSINTHIFFKGLALLRRKTMMDPCCLTWVGRGWSNLTLGNHFTAWATNSMETVCGDASWILRHVCDCGITHERIWVTSYIVHTELAVIHSKF